MQRKQAKQAAMSVSEIASALSNVRWAKASKRERARMGRILTESRKRIPKAKRHELASNAAASISPEAAQARAKKAWKTKRQKAAEKKISAA